MCYLICRDTLWVKNFIEITLSSMFFEIQAFLCFAIFAENSKWPPFLVRQIFLKIGMVTLQRYPADQIYRRNRSI